MTNRQKARAYLLEQLKKPAAWRGLTLILTSLGIAVSPEVSEAITALGMAVAGLIGWLAPDPSPK